MNTAAQFVVISAVSLAAAGTTWLLNGSPAAPEVSVVQCDSSQIREDEICLADVAPDVLWVDARLRSEWEENGLDGSILWNFDSNEDPQALEAEVVMNIVSAEPAMVVVYCGSEACGTSRQIADRVRALGLGPPVKVLYGGWDALRFRDSN